MVGGFIKVVKGKWAFIINDMGHCYKWTVVLSLWVNEYFRGYRIFFDLHDFCK